MTSVIMAVVKAVHDHEVRSRAWSSLRNVSMSTTRSRTPRGCSAWRGSRSQRVELDAGSGVGWCTWSPTTRPRRRARRAGCSPPRSRAGYAPVRGTCRYGQVPLRLVWHKRRWRCREAALPRRVVHRVSAAGPGPGAVDHPAAAAGRVPGSPSGSPACWPRPGRTGCPGRSRTPRSSRTSPGSSSRPLPAVAVLGIDETRRGKPIWAQDPVTGPVAGACTTGGTPRSSTPPAPAGCSPTSTAGPPRGDRVACRAAGFVAGAGHARDDRPVRLLRQGGRRRAPGRGPGRRPVPPRRARPTRCSPRSASTPPGRPAAAAAARRTPSGPPAGGCCWLTSASPGDAFARLWNALIDAGEPGIEILHAYTVKERPARPARAAGPNADREADLAPAVPVLRPGRRQRPRPRPTASPRPSRPGGQPSTPRSPPATPTPAPRATTASPSTSDGTPSASATRSTTDAAYAGPAPANTGERQPRPPDTARLSSMSPFESTSRGRGVVLGRVTQRTSSRRCSAAGPSGLAKPIEGGLDGRRRRV